MESDPTAWEIRAAAQAASGNYAEAQKDQKKALSIARRLGWDVAPQQARLDKYARGSAWAGDLFAL